MRSGELILPTFGHLNFASKSEDIASKIDLDSRTRRTVNELPHRK